MIVKVDDYLRGRMNKCTRLAVAISNLGYKVSVEHLLFVSKYEVRVYAHNSFSVENAYIYYTINLDRDAEKVNKQFDDLEESLVDLLARMSGHIIRG